MNQVAENSTATDEIYPFSLRLMPPYEGYFYDKHNESAKLLKNYLKIITGDILAANHLGQFASGLVHGQVHRIRNQEKTHLYELAEGGKGITFNDPTALYRRWNELETQVGPKMQEAMRNLLDSCIPKR
ncbi:MAG: hypothetical protein QFB86_00245 [Patescibacteria group bacterium]|nr:hypothetical protein [Patescibacteria group bacterium]